MKKLIALLLAMVLSLSLFACSGNDKKKTDSGNKDTELDDTPGPSTSGVDTNVSPVGDVDYGLGRYRTTVTFQKVVYAIYENGAVVYDCFCPKDVIEIPGTVEFIYVDIPEPEPEPEPEPDEGGENLPEGDGQDTTVPEASALAAAAEDDEVCEDCIQNGMAGHTEMIEVKAIGNAAFYKVGASEIKLPDSIEYIGADAFRSCTNLKTVNFPAKLKTIGDRAFAFTAVESVDIDSDISYGKDVYYFCKSLTKITASEGVTEIPAGIVSSCENLTEIVIGNGVTKIGDEAFFCCYNIKEINLPEKLESIGDKAFYGCALVENVELPDSVKSIGAYAFYNCKSLEDISLGSSLESLGAFTFFGCDLITEIDLPGSLKTLGKGVFGSLAIEEITIPSGVTVIPEMAFANCSKLKDVNFSANLTAIDSKAFMNTSLETFDVPASVKTLGSYAFQNCTLLKSVSIKGSAKLIPEGIFSGCTALNSVSLPATVETIALYAFENCSSIENIKLPASLKIIQYFAFRNCSSLKSVNLHETELEKMGMAAFSNCTSLTEVTIPASCVSLTHDEPKLPIGVTVNGLFDGCTSLKKVTILGQIETLGAKAFMGCTALEKITLPDSLFTIGVDAFRNCLKLSDVKLGENLYEIGRGAFFNCPSLTELRFGEKLAKIGGYAFGFLENDVVIEGIITKPIINKNFTAYGYLGNRVSNDKIVYSAFDLYVRSYVDIDGNCVNHVGLGFIGDIKTEYFDDFEYEILKDAVEYTETVINEETGEEETVVIKKDGVRILKYKGSDKIVVIPEMFDAGNLFVIEIADGAFKGNANVEVIYVPSWIKTVGNEAFANCPALVELIFVATSYQLPADAPAGSVAGEITLGTDFAAGSDNVKLYAPAGSYLKVNEKTLGIKVETKIPDHTPVPETPEEPENPEA